MSKGEEGFCPFAYQGQIIDKETGLYYNRFRYYSPEEGMYISQDPIGLYGGSRFYGYVDNPNEHIDPFGLKGQRWENKTKNNGEPYAKPGPKPKGEGDHNAKITEVINRESTKPGVTHIGGGDKTEIILDTKGGNLDSRRMDTSFRREDGSEYHINVGRTLVDGKTGVIREREALDDVRNAGYEVDFEGYGLDKDYRGCSASN